MTARLSAIGLLVGHGGPPLLPALDLDVAPREIVAVVGASGAGKSTLLATIAGILPPMGGRVRVDGTDVTDRPIHERGIGLVFQEPLLFPHLDARDNVAYGLRRRGRSRAEARAAAADLLAWVGLAGLERRAVTTLSGGQAQRVALARALAPEPAVLLLDEPFSALDADLRERLAAEVAALLRERGTAALHVTHDQREAVAMGDRILRI
jgi:thiamine transport system ATP-binding protein